MTNNITVDHTWIQSPMQRLEDVLLDYHKKFLPELLISSTPMGEVFVMSGVTPSVVSLERWQTPAKWQESRGTCHAFAVVAAIEARYRREYGVVADLSEQYAFHINKSCELLDAPIENNTSTTGFQGAGDIVQKFARSPLPVEADAPYMTDAQMRQLQASIPEAGPGFDTQEQRDAFEYDVAHIPTAARQRCNYRVKEWARIDADLLSIERALASGHEVIVDVPGHTVLFVGYDGPNKKWLVKDSAPGALVTYDYSSMIQAAHIVRSVHPAATSPDLEAAWLGRWNMDHDGWRGHLVIRRTYNHRDMGAPATRLGHYYRNGKRYEVNGTVHDGGRQLHFWIADTTAATPWGARVGQEFRAYLFTRDLNNAGGATTWSGIPFGVSLSRHAIAPVAAGAFTPDQLDGAWAMDHDGWRGTLRVDAAPDGSIRGSYTPNGGTGLPMRGHVGGHGHELRIEIDFPKHRQPFTLLVHTRERGVLSGTTVWSGKTFGVNGSRA